MSRSGSRAVAKASLLAALLLLGTSSISAQSLNITYTSISSAIPIGITPGSDGALWFTLSGSINGPAIGRITTVGLVTNEYTMGITSGSLPNRITAGPDGALWFTEQIGNNIGRITTSGAITETPVPTQASQPYGIAAGPDVALWFTESNGNKIGRITTTGVITEYLIPTQSSLPAGITAGSDGALWFTEGLGNKIGRITTAGVITEYPILTTPGSQPFEITAGPDGALWFTESNGNKIGRITTTGVVTEYPIPTQGSFPAGITAGPDAALWFTEESGSKIGRITTAGGITEYPTQGFGLIITTGPDGALWFTEPEGAQIGRAAIIPKLTVTASCPAPYGVLNQPYSFPITTSGGLAPLTWALTAGSLPPGLTLNTTTGVISGIPTALGPYKFTVTVTDSSTDLQQTATYTCAIQVVPVLTITAPCPAPSGDQGRPYSFTITTTGGLAPITWTLTSGSLPTGLTLNTTTGVVAGTPTVPGTYPFTVTVTDASGQSAPYTCSITIIPVLSITTGCPFPSVQTGNVLSPVLLTATGGTGTYTFSVIGNLPPNLQLIGSAIGGLVTAPPGNYVFTLQVMSGDQTAQKPCGITVTAAAVPLQITSACPASPITQGVSFYYNFTAIGGTGSYSWSIVTGSLPNGLALLASYIYGTPTGPPSTSNFTIQVSSGDQTTSLSCSLTVSSPQLQITSGCPGKGTQGVAYGPFTLTATGGLGPGTYTFSIQGSLPPGVTLSGNTISGTPTASGTYNFTVSVTSGTQTVAGPSCSVMIAPPPLLITGSCPASPSLTGVLVSVSVSVTGGQSPYNFTLSGPSWLTLSSSGPNATASGTPGPTNVGSFPITITVTDSAQSTPATFNCTLTINRPVLQLSGTCPANPITAGASISIPLGATGGLPPYNWTLGGNSGLGLSSPSGASNGVTGNAPGTLGNYSLTIGLSDSANSTASLSCTLNVQLPALQITGTCPAASLNLPLTLSVPLTAVGGQPPYSWSLTAPSWLALSNQTGPATTIANSGPPDTYGPFSFTATLKDSANATTAFPCSSSINQPVIPTVTVTGLTATTTLTQPVSVGLQLAAPAPLPLTGVVQLSFIPNAFGVTDNPQVVFDGGLRTQSFTLAAGQSTVALPDNIQQGTVAGTIHVEVVDLKQGTNEVLPTPHPFAELAIPRLAPVIANTDVTFANETANGFDVVISGYSTPRDMKTVALTFSAAQGATLTGTISFSVDVSSVFTQFYSSSASQSVGSMFSNLHVPVTVTGDKTAIGSVSVVMSNSAGNSQTIMKTR